jgi:phenylacetic acid degradation operon negative regulatory protein
MRVSDIDVDQDIPTSQSIVLDFLGLYVLGRAQSPGHPVRPVPTQVFLTVLGALGYTGSTVRTTLNRMVARGALARHTQGRTSAFEPTEDTLHLLRRGRARMFSPRPFDHAEDIWTILNCPIPESMRNVRYQVHGRLAWAGFGQAQATMWVAPGRIDVEELLCDIFPAEALALLQAFHGTPAAPSSSAQLVSTAWDTEALRARHHRFAARWQDAKPAPDEALPQLLLLIDDWGELLRTDPGLPATHLGGDWPAEHSTRIFRRLDAQLGPAAEQRLEQLLAAATLRRANA